MQYRKNYWMVKHDLSRHNLYHRWSDMKNRCYNEKSRLFKYYGKRGIEVCAEWTNKETGFTNFYEWSINNGFSKDLSIDRINNDGNYSPENCRWVSKRVQNINKRPSVPNTSGFVGISRHSNGKFWYGRVRTKDKTLYTGKSLDALEAARMRDECIIRYGLENELNFPRINVT